MKKIIKNLNISIKEFADIYEIPYNTVRQWYNEERKMPEYLKKLIEKDIECRSKGTQMKITNKIYYFCYNIDEKGRTCVFRGEYLDSVQKWIRNVKSKEKWIDVHEIIKTYEKENFQEILDK